MNEFSTCSSVVHFVGIGGIGMSGIADIMINLGYKVSGSDLKENVMTAKLARKGIEIFIGHEAKNVHGATVVVVSSAVGNDNVEIKEARRLKIPVVIRAEMLAELMKMKQSIAIAGTHGKTTTTSLVAAILDQASMDPTVVNGGIINAYNSNARLGAGEWIVVEADESDGSFTRLMTTIAIVTNIDLDHVNNFTKLVDIESVFERFLERIPFYGAGVLCIDHPVVNRLAKRIVDRKIITYGISNEADVMCVNVSLSEKGCEFDVKFSKSFAEMYSINNVNEWKRFILPMFGMHNVQNALAAIAVAVQLGISRDNVRLALGSFMGVKRRFTKVASVNGVTVIDDYGHHPVEIEAVLKAAKSTCEGRIFAVLQTHRYSRLKHFLDEFSNVMELSDFVYVTPTYAAGEKFEGVDHNTLLEKMQKKNIVQSRFAGDVTSIYTDVKDQLKSGDYVIFLGAGDITKWAYEFAELLEKGELNVINECATQS